MKRVKKQANLQNGAAILLVTAVVTKIIGAFFKIPLASSACLGDVGFGYFSSAYDLFSPIYSLAVTGLPIAVSKTVSEYAARSRYNDVRSALAHSLKLYTAVGAVGTAVLALAVIPFVRLTDAADNNMYAFFALAPSFFFCCVISAYKGYYEGLLNMRPAAVSELAEALCKLFLGYFAAYFTVRLTGDVALGAAAAIFGITVGTAAAALYLWLYNRIKGDGITARQIAESPEREEGTVAVKGLMLISLSVAAASLSSNIPLIADAVTVKRSLSGLDYEALSGIRHIYAAGYSVSDISVSQLPTFLYGVKSKAYTLYNLVPSFVSVLAVGSVPVISACFAAKDWERLNININSALKLSGVISFPAGVGIIVLNSRITALLYGGAYPSGAADMAALFGAAALFAGPAVLLTAVLQAVGKHNRALVNIAIGTVIKFCVNLTVGIESVNINGVAFGTLAFYAAVCLLNIFSLIGIKIKPDITGSIIKPFAAAAVCGAAAYAVSLVSRGKTAALFAILIAALVYLIMLFSLKVLNESDFYLLTKSETVVKFCRKHRIIS